MQNIAATFDDPNSARLAMSRVESAGIPRERIHFSPSADADFIKHAGPSQPRPGQPGYRRQSVLESIGGFFANLLESHTDESGIYSEALRRGTSLLLIEVERDQAQKVIRVLQDCGAISLEDRVGQWRTEGWEPAAPGAGTAAPSSGGVHAASPTGTAAAASPSRAGGPQAGATMRGGPVGTHSFAGGGAAVGMPSTAGTQVGGAGSRPDGTDIADTGGDPTLPGSHTTPTPGETARLRERAVAASEKGGADVTDSLNRGREPGANR
ncbi:hypothetical protein JI739_00705 [Ramlibacter sp. AW1]|uniref:Uncharacterized protein n=1 Tax=Ramlibacter aurantiacus TaxID=2801330 RepID=A0A936ZC50_9BURK|nr:hypothetical protein [Ramlibacter aurantiacus]MBL0418854.1 hypothetical protein [Ramlibacter aurantiacus]